MKLTFVIAVVAVVLIAGTITLCVSGVINESTTEYGSIHAMFESFFNPYRTVCQ